MRPRHDGAGYRPDIDGLRCVAVMAVVLSHAGIPGAAGGFIGVDVFFVISGYLITRIIAQCLERGTYSIVDFYERRARRILPALFAMFAATLLVAIVALDPHEFDTLAKTAIAAALFASNVAFWWSSGGYFGEDVHLNPLLHTWSLGVEEQFYIFFPPLLWLAWRFARRFVTPLVALATILSLAGAVTLVLTSRSEIAFFLLPPRAWELGVGSVLALGTPAVPASGRLRAGVAGIALAATLAPVALYSPATPFPGLAAAPPVLGTAALIWVNGAGDNPVKRLLSTRACVGIGLISYSLYLWHWPVIVFAQIFRGALTPMLAAGAIGLSLILAVLSWRFVERPFRDRHGVLPRRAALFGASAAGIAAVVAVSALIIGAGGFPGRLPPAAAVAFAAARDVDPRSTGCWKDLSAEPCRIGSPDGDRIEFLLWGDSHAGAAIPGVEFAAARAGRTGYAATMGGCAPLLGTARLDMPNGERCPRLNEAALGLLEDHDDIRVVVLAARWQLATDSIIIGEDRSPALLEDLSGDLPSGRPGDNFAIFEAAITRTVDAILATGRRVVVLGAVPEVGWSVPVEVGRGRMHDHPPPAVPTRDHADARIARSDGVFRDLAARGRITYLPLLPAFCDETCAILAADGRPLYSDDDHLTRTASVERIAPILFDAIWGPAGIVAAMR